MGHSAIRKQCFDFKHLVPSGTIDNGSRTRRVVANHTANHGAVGGRSNRTEKKPIRLEKPIEFVSNHSWLNPQPSLLRIDFEDFGKIPGDIHHNPIAYALTCQGCSCCPRDQRSLVFICKID